MIKRRKQYNKIKTGDSFTNNAGLIYDVIEVKNQKNILIQYRESLFVSRVRADEIRSGRIRDAWTAKKTIDTCKYIIILAGVAYFSNNPVDKLIALGTASHLARGMALGLYDNAKTKTGKLIKLKQNRKYIKME